jgi:limonene 1,2-monooxygenase
MHLRFGAFIGPIHPVGQNPTLALQRDVELVQLLETLDYDEVWFGEHHSSGVELISAPEVFIAHVAAQTSRIKLGTGAITLPYHNPLWVADRMILLDHLTRGRAMCGVGPGSLPPDAHMIGLSMLQTRDALEEDLPVLMHLLNSDEPISVTTDRYELHDARCQLRPYSHPCFEVATPGVASPIGPRMAGRYGLGLLSIASSTPQGFEALANHWGILEEQAAAHGQTADRARWRLTGSMHIAETREQALKDIEHGFMDWFDYYRYSTAHPAFRFEGETFSERLDYLNRIGAIVVGTPDDAIAELERFWKQTDGGFGCYLHFEHDWVTPAAKRRHHELFAQYVMPHFQDQLTRPMANERWVRATQPANLAEAAQGMQRYMDEHAPRPTQAAS